MATSALGHQMMLSNRLLLIIDTLEMKSEFWKAGKSLEETYLLCDWAQFPGMETVPEVKSCFMKGSFTDKPLLKKH